RHGRRGRPREGAPSRAAGHALDPPGAGAEARARYRVPAARALKDRSMLAGWAHLLLTCAAASGGAAPAIDGYIRDIPAESGDARAARKHRVAERRAAPAVIVHRGASA